MTPPPPPSDRRSSSASDQLGRSSGSIIMKTKDRISALPDSVLVYILSLIPFKSVVRTSILSRRWRELCKELWAYKSTLDFGKEFSGRQTPEEFTRNVNRFLRLHIGKEIKKFHIFFYSGEAYEAIMKYWIRFATEKGVQELDLNLSQRIQHSWDDGFVDVRKPSQLPVSCVFNCDSLKHLQLIMCHLYPCIKLNRSTSLRSVNFRQVNINEDGLKSLLSYCPHLEALALRKCEQLGKVDVSSSVPSLRCLRVVDCECIIKIDAPTLTSFHFHGDLCGMDLLDVPSLVDALITSSVWNEEPEHYWSCMKNLMHVKVLTICTETLEGFVILEKTSPGKFPMTFPNLQELQLLIGHEPYLEEIYGFFRLCPCPLLQSLFIELPLLGAEVEEEAVEVPSGCVLDHLKTVKINGFQGLEDEIQLVKFFLEKAIGLKSMILVAPESVPWMPDVPLAVLREKLLFLKEAFVSNQIVLRVHSEDGMFSPMHVEVYSYPLIHCKNSP